ncbi:MAG: hypothetical protein LH702_24040 [Phormidesmis sp. CAN_BIN44]|nr:hypothetical protein [Phormidesmis sp. CAN_BIN44]
MANVRNRAKVEPVSIPKGLPQHLSDLVQDQYEYDCEHFCAAENHTLTPG